MNADSLSEVIRRALAVYETLWRVTHDEGSTVVVKGPEEGKERELLLG